MTALTVASCQKDIVDDIVAGDIDPLEGVNLAYEKQMIEEAEDRLRQPKLLTQERALQKQAALNPSPEYKTREM